MIALPIVAVGRQFNKIHFQSEKVKKVSDASVVFD